MGKGRTHSPEFKARVAMEAISGRKTIKEIAADHAMGSRHAAHLPVRPDPGEPVEAVSSHARCRFRTSDILLVRQALYR